MRFLIIDIGAGTMDILYHDTDLSVQYKAVVKSPALTVTEKLSAINGDLLITGVEMGGGSMAGILKEKAERNEILMSLSASATINHDLAKVRSLGITVIEDEKAEDLKKSGRYTHLDISDLEHERIQRIVEGVGVSFPVDILGVCAQDHGVPEPGISHLDYRHNIFKEKLDKSPFPHEMLYEYSEVPDTFNRLKSISRRAKLFSATEVYVMDSGMAAILGGTLDPAAAKKEKIIVLDIATSHTVGAAFENEELAGFFEYHTKDISLEILEKLLADLADGRLDHAEILSKGGHGAYTRKSFGFDNLELILSTGPKRALVEGSSLEITPGAPIGDNMMTGTAGVLETIRKKKGLNKI
ncbi:MAG: DUF1786 family protein [Desulfobacteraceae bacterium]|jgi:uncharacterized protein (DUF1786 family)